jgi:membrane-bound serine protease (ClpP class)
MAFFGAAGILVAVFLLFFVFLIPNNELSAQIDTSALIIAIILLAIIFWIVLKAARANLSKIKTGKEALIGAFGVAVTDLNPEGSIRIVGEFWQAISEGDMIKSGETVKVTGMEGMRLTVIPIKEKP